MRKFATRLRGIIWPAVIAVVIETISVIAAVTGASLQVVVSVAMSGLVMAVLTPNEGR